MQPAALDPVTLDAFEEQMTEDSFRCVLEYGRRRAAAMYAGGVAPDDAAAMAQDAVTETLTRAAPWDPTRSSLAAHLCGVIRRRALGERADDASTDELDRLPPWRAARRDVFDLLDFTRVRLELAWRDLRVRARAERHAALTAATA